MLEGRKCWREVILQRSKKKKTNEKIFFFFLKWGVATRLHNLRKCTDTVPLCVSVPPPLSAGSVSLGVFLVSVAFVVCAVWLVALCGVCTWCQRKLVGRRPAAHVTLFGLKCHLDNEPKHLLGFLGGFSFHEMHLFFNAGLQAGSLNNNKRHW